MLSVRTLRSEIQRLAFRTPEAVLRSLNSSLETSRSSEAPPETRAHPLETASLWAQWPQLSRLLPRQELNRTCRAMQQRVLELIPRITNEQLTEELLIVNDNLNNVFLRHER